MAAATLLFRRSVGVTSRLAVTPRRAVEEFFLSATRKPTDAAAGSAWQAADLRGKSFEDLHSLWYVLLKERNALQTERLYYKQIGMMQPNPSRLTKVKKSMARLQTVLGERQRAHKAAQAATAVEEASVYDPRKFFLAGYRNGEYKKGLPGRSVKSEGHTLRQWHQIQKAAAMRKVGRGPTKTVSGPAVPPEAGGGAPY